MSRKAIADSYKRCFADPDGKRVLADLMMVCGVYDQVSESDPVKLGMIQGARNVALHIAAQMNFRAADFVERADDDDHIVDSVWNNGETYQ